MEAKYLRSEQHGCWFRPKASDAPKALWEILKHQKNLEIPARSLIINKQTFKQIGTNTFLFVVLVLKKVIPLHFNKLPTYNGFRFWLLRASFWVFHPPAVRLLDLLRRLKPEETTPAKTPSERWMPKCDPFGNCLGDPLAKIKTKDPKSPKWLKHLLRRCFGVVLRGKYLLRRCLDP